LKESIFIEQTMVIGADRKFVSALIVPSFPNLLDWCRQQGIHETDPAMLCKHPRIIEHYQELIESFNKFFNPVEQVKKFSLLPNDWGVDSGELTPKLSLKRTVILEKFKEAIEQIYA
jgi:long-chain acyl-CoA synthetase